MVESRARIEHTVHPYHRPQIQRTDRLIECSGAGKHCTNISHFTDIPRRYIGVEECSSTEQTRHVGYLRDITCANGR